MFTLTPDERRAMLLATLEEMDDLGDTVTTPDHCSYNDFLKFRKDNAGRARYLWIGATGQPMGNSVGSRPGNVRMSPIPDFD